MEPERNFPVCHQAGLYHPGSGYNIRIGDKLYSLWRAKVFSSAATNFGVSSNSDYSLVSKVITLPKVSKVFSLFLNTIKQES